MFLISCKTKCVRSSKTADRRCLDLKSEARKRGEKAGVCYVGPLTVGLDKEAKHPDPEACRALGLEAQKKCDALPPDPNSLKTFSGTRVYKGKELVSVNGEPVSKGLPDCDECKDCEPID